MQLKIISWNIWIDGYFDQTVDFLKTSSADIIGLQEVRADDPGRNIIGYLEELGYKHVFAPVKKTWGEKVWNDGPAIFSKYNIIKSEKFILSKTDCRAAIMADFNATPDSTAIKSLKNTHVDSDPTSAPTWSLYPEGCLECNPQDVSTRLDYIFTSKDIKTNSFKAENSKGSDHLPISVIIEI